MNETHRPIRKSELSPGLEAWGSTPGVGAFVIEKSNGTKHLCRYQDGSKRWWSQSHILKYYFAIERSRPDVVEKGKL